MWEVISVIVLIAVGLVGVKKLQSSKRKGIHIPSPNEDRFSSQTNCSESVKPSQPVQRHDGLDLSRLKSIFESYSIEVSAYDALYHLLNAIEKKSYIETLRAVNEKASTPADLIELINSQLPMEAFDKIQLGTAQGGPFVSKDYIKNLCKDVKISSEGNVEDLVKNLIIANVKSGMQHFYTVFEFKLQNMKRKFDAGEDISKDFADIKAKFAERLRA